MRWDARGGKRCAAGACAGLAALLAVCGAARAQESPEPFAVDYDAPVGCPDGSAFFGEVTARTPRARAARGAEKARVLHVRIVKRGENHAGSLAIEDSGATSTAREVSGGSCAEVVGALGLVAALAVDPRASVAPRPAPGAAAAAGSPTAGATNEPPPPPPPASPASQPAARPPNDDKSAEEQSADAREAGAPKPPADRRVDPSTRAPGRREPRRWTIGGGAEISSLAGAVVALRAFGDLDLGGGLFAPALRVALSRTVPVDRPALVGVATLTWTAGAIDLCPIRLDLARTVAARPCAGLGAGILEAEGSGVATPRSETRAWVAASALARLVWAPAGWLALELEGGGVAPLLRESFFFDPNVLVYQPPVIAGFGRLAAGVRFP